jgi:hypothetical protein
VHRTNLVLATRIENRDYDMTRVAFDVGPAGPAGQRVWQQNRAPVDHRPGGSQTLPKLARIARIAASGFP